MRESNAHSIIFETEVEQTTNPATWLAWVASITAGGTRCSICTAGATLSATLLLSLVLALGSLGFATAALFASRLTNASGYVLASTLCLGLLFVAQGALTTGLLHVCFVGLAGSIVWMASMMLGFGKQRPDPIKHPMTALLLPVMCGIMLVGAGALGSRPVRSELHQQKNQHTYSGSLYAQAKRPRVLHHRPSKKQLTHILFMLEGVVMLVMAATLFLVSLFRRQP